MTERLLTSCFYDGFPNEFRFYVKDAEPAGLRHLVSRSEGRDDFAAGIPAGWTDSHLMALIAKSPFAIPGGRDATTYPPVEFSARVMGLPRLVSASEVEEAFNKKKPPAIQSP